MINEKIREYRSLFMGISVIEHHQMKEPTLSTYDICEKLGPLWDEMQEEIKDKAFTFDAECILNLNKRIADKFGAEGGTFIKEKTWSEFVDACGDIEDDPAHVSSWIFSAIYWNRMTKFRISTAWLLVNAIRAQYKLPLFNLSVENLGPFMQSLSGSGPPIYDGQTFYPEEYS